MKIVNCSISQSGIQLNMAYICTRKAEELSVDPALLASKRELESLIFTADGDEIPERFLGWRKAVISDELIVLKEQAA